jgi:hypothetical protein
MTELVFDLERERYDDLWLTGRVIDETHLHLARVKIVIKKENRPDVTVHKYYAQAREKMFLIPVTKSSIPFIIDISDLETDIRIKKELEHYYNEDRKTFEYILKIVAGKFFENLDFGYYHGSIMRNLRVKLA